MVWPDYFFGGHSEESGTRYIDTGGENDIILLLHDGAFGGSIETSWMNCIPLLASRYRVISLDFFGFGKSDKIAYFDRNHHIPRVHQIVQLLKHLGITEAIHLVGTSFGGSVALRAGSSGLLNLRSVTSISGPGPINKTPLMNDELGKWDGTLQDLARIVGYLMDRGEYFNAQVAERFESARSEAHYRSLTTPTVAVPEGLERFEREQWPQVLEGSATPTLLVAGERDVLFEPGWPESLAENLLDVTTIRIDTQHSPNLDYPELVADLIDSFCSQH